MVPRETIMAALVAKLTAITFSAPVGGVTTWQEVSRKLKLFDQANARPCLFVTEHSETWRYQSLNTPPIVTIDCILFIYTASRGSATPSTDLNVVLEAVVAALNAAPYESQQTLGGLVYSCQIVGNVFKDPGDIDGDGFLMIPVRITGP